MKKIKRILALLLVIFLVSVIKNTIMKNITLNMYFFITTTSFPDLYKSV